MTASKKGNSIKKRSTTRVYKSIREIKAHEKRYTFLLVLFFIILFILIGYFSLRVK